VSDQDLGGSCGCCAYSLLSDPWTFVTVGVAVTLVLSALMAFGVVPWLNELLA
jgi:hypothetical protein